MTTMSAQPRVSEDCRKHCRRLGTLQVRRLLQQGEFPSRWRDEAEAWLQQRLRLEGRRTLRLLVAAIVMQSAAICALALWLW